MKWVSELGILLCVMALFGKVDKVKHILQSNMLIMINIIIKQIKMI